MEHSQKYDANVGTAKNTTNGIKMLPKPKYWQNNNIESFIKKGKKSVIPANSWFVYAKDMDVYMRTSYRNGLLTLDIANVTVNDEIKRGRGIFTGFVNYVHELAYENGYQAIFFENVMNQSLNKKFKNLVKQYPQQWITKDNYGEICSYTYLIKSHVLDIVF